MKKSHALRFILAFGAGLLALAPFLPEQVRFESLESQAVDGLPAINQIRLFTTRTQDVWMMNQSHHGPDASPEQIDRLAIVVDKTKSPKTAKFLQLEPGPLEWQEDLPQRDYKMSCFFCHNNGPRAIRPVFSSSNAKLNLQDRITIGLWNTRMKLYGRVIGTPKQDTGGAYPFQLSDDRANEILNVSSCTTCHRESGFMARGRLHRQQRGTIEFMVKSGSMPPPGFSLSEADKIQIQGFIMGFN